MKTTFIFLLVALTLNIKSQELQKENEGQIKLSGIVKDQNGQALYGALVYVNQSGVTTTTDSTGAYNLFVEKKFPIKLKANYVGYLKTEKEIKEEPQEQIDFLLELDNSLNEVQIVSSRRREEAVQDIPIPITVISGKKAEDAGAFNVNRVKELFPSVQLYSSNP